MNSMSLRRSAVFTGLLLAVASCAWRRQPDLDARRSPAPRAAGRLNCGRSPDWQPHAPAGSRWIRAAYPDSQLLAGNRGRIVVTLYSAGTRENMTSAFVGLVGDHFDRVVASQVSPGRYRLDAPAGVYKFMVRQFAFLAVNDTAVVRAGFADTVDIGLGDEPICLENVVFTGARERPEPRVAHATNCSALHGANDVNAYASNPPRWYLGTQVDSLLAATGRGRIVAIVYGAKDRKNLADAYVRLDLKGAGTDSVGFARLLATAGKHALAILRVGYDRWDDSIVVRAGHTDTLEVGLGNSPICLY